jgi:hypothetical protein
MCAAMTARPAPPSAMREAVRTKLLLSADGLNSGELTTDEVTDDLIAAMFDNLDRGAMAVAIGEVIMEHGTLGRMADAAIAAARAAALLPDR